MPTPREQVMAAQDLQPLEIPGGLPEWGLERVFVRPLSGLRLAAYQERSRALREAAKKEDRPVLSWLLPLFTEMTLCDAAGELVFQPGDVDWLGEKSAAVLQVVWDTGAVASGVGVRERLEKNSPAASTDSSPSVSA